jgi:parvulin-like peptidyl-prolyl isomerase
MSAPSAFDANVRIQPVGKPVARVNGAVLTDRDLLREMYSMFPYAQQHNGGFPKGMEADIRKGALQMIEFEELAYQEALRRKMTVPPAKMERAVRDFRKQFATPDEYRNFVKTQADGSEKAVRTRIQRSLLIDQFMKLEVADKAPVTLIQAKEYYRKNPETFRVAESFAIQSISILPPAKATPAVLKEARKRAEDAFRQAKATTSYEQFGMLAEKISDDDYHVNMGDHKAVEATKMPPNVLKALQAMQPGQVTGLLEFDGSYAIYRLNKHIPAGMMKFEDIKVPLRKQLTKNHGEQLRIELGKKLRKTAKVEEL